ncbi:helix-turn-helix domain-containing protein [Myxosarcina sp. GI1]|uniref:helix-turn-helix domain-containing protein n=1 Tax=Myxosarcina sp. GI1 TaxID=1541065 RepID=UPI00068EB8EF|nr:AraC family transcriptional regulator [Myxosarcina sp. GI1]
MNFARSIDYSNIEKFNSFADTNMLVKIEQILLQSQPSNPVLSKVFNFIEENYQERIGLREVAEEVKRSPAYLTDLVRRKTGKTVLTWITERRMAEARMLLLKTNQSIEQITEAVGYFDRRHFSRLFLRSHNSTPHAWRMASQSRNDILAQVDRQKFSNFTPTEAQKLKNCLREIAEILYNNTANDEIFNLDSIEQGFKGFIYQSYDGSLQIFLSLNDKQNKKLVAVPCFTNQQRK